MTREEAREQINARPLTDFIQLQPSPKAGKSFFICPLCGSGTGKNKTSAFHIYPNSNRAICESCGGFGAKGEDTLGALRIVWNCSEAEAIERAGVGNLEKLPPAPKEEPKPPADYTAFYLQAHKDLLNSKAGLFYLRNTRGITDDSIKKYMLGYCEEWKHPSAPNSTPTRRVIIPRSAESYTARLIDPPRNDYEAQRKKMTTKQSEIFNIKALEGAEVVFIVEGELDAISLEQAGAPAVVGLGSITNRGAMLEKAKEHPNTAYIVLLDNDEGEQGQKAQAELVAGMKQAGLFVYDTVKASEVYDGAKDGNEAYIKDPERLKNALAFITLDAKEQQKEKNADFLDRFILNTQGETYRPYKTGLKFFDDLTRGGLMRQTFTLFLANTGMGKTTFCQQLAENIARGGLPVYYLNLEMSKEQMTAKAISRRLAEKGKIYGTLDILQGYALTEEERQEIRNEVSIYRQDTYKNIRYLDGTDNITDIEGLKKFLEDRLKMAEGKEQAPAIFIDYLHLITSEKGLDDKELIKQVVVALKDYAIRGNTFTFGIGATNRAAGEKITLQSGRDSSNLEFTGDNVITLNYYEVAKGKPTEEDIDRLKKENWKKLLLKFEKGRFLPGGTEARCYMNGKCNIFYGEGDFIPAELSGGLVPFMKQQPKKY